MKKFLLISVFPFFLHSQNATITGVYTFSGQPNSYYDNFCSHGDWSHMKGDGLFCPKMQLENKILLDSLRVKIQRLESEIVKLKVYSPR